MSEPADPLASHRRNELALLFDISLILDRSLDLRDEVGAILRALAKHTGMVRGNDPLNRETDGSDRGRPRPLRSSESTRYRPGEGVTEWSSRPRPWSFRDLRGTLFLDKTGRAARCAKMRSPSCAPIKIENEVLGALSADRIYHEPVSLDEDLHLLTSSPDDRLAVHVAPQSPRDQQRLID